MYVMTVLKGEIHSAGITVGGETKAYAWYNGVCSQVYMTINGAKYGVGSYVNNAAYANSIDYAFDKKDDVNHQLISNATRSYMALGTFDDDTDIDMGCILLNIVDLSDVGYNADMLSGETISFSGYIGPNDNSGRFESIYEGKNFTIKN